MSICLQQIHILEIYYSTSSSLQRLANQNGILKLSMNSTVLFLFIMAIKFTGSIWLIIICVIIVYNAFTGKHYEKNSSIKHLLVHAVN